jgi:hypothetical protein
MDGAGLIDEAARFCKEEELLELLELLKGWYRDRLVVGYGCDDLIVNSDIFVEGNALGTRGAAKGFAKAYSAVEQARVNVTPPRYGNKALTIEKMMITLREIEVAL